MKCSKLQYSTVLKVNFIKSVSAIEEISKMPIFNRISFIIHNSLFIQLIITTIAISIILIYVHFKFRDRYNRKYEELIKISKINKKIEVIEEESKF